jgi:hypothetical protein
MNGVYLLFSLPWMKVRGAQHREVVNGSHPTRFAGTPTLKEGG